MPLLQNLNKSSKNECFCLIDIINEAPEAIKFVKYIDSSENIGQIIENLTNDYISLHQYEYDNENTEEIENYIYNLAEKFKLV